MEATIILAFFFVSQSFGESLLIAIEREGKRGKIDYCLTPAPIEIS